MEKTHSSDGFRLKCGFLALNYSCNLRCKWCYARPAGFDATEMDFQRARQYLGLMAELGATDVGFIGGEPLLHSRVFELASYGKGLGLRVTLYSNGVMLSSRKIVEKAKAAGVSCINLSIQGGRDGSNRHDETVGMKGAWEKTRKGVGNCVEVGIPLAFQTVIAHTDLSVYRGLLDEFAFAKAPFIFYRETPSNIGCLQMFQHKVMSNRETRDVYKQIHQHAKSLDLKTYLFARMPLCWFNEADPVERELRDQVVSHCHILSGVNLIVEPNDNVIPCATFVNLPSMNMVKNGKVLTKEEFLKEWMEGKPAEIRCKLKYYPHEDCKTCKEFGTRCTGGCPLIEFDKPPKEGERPA